jgi:hypothetical protein
MSNKSKKLKTTRGAPLTRVQLLPITPATARAFSLKYHLALVAMRHGRGNADLASELIKTLYLTYFISEKGRLDPSIATYLKAEAVLRVVHPRFGGARCVADCRRSVRGDRGGAGRA